MSCMYTVWWGACHHLSSLVMQMQSFTTGGAVSLNVSNGEFQPVSYIFYRFFGYWLASQFWKEQLQVAYVIHVLKDSRSHERISKKLNCSQAWCKLTQHSSVYSLYKNLPFWIELQPSYSKFKLKKKNNKTDFRPVHKSNPWQCHMEQACEVVTGSIVYLQIVWDKQ